MAMAKGGIRWERQAYWAGRFKSILRGKAAYFEALLRNARQDEELLLLVALVAGIAVVLVATAAPAFACLNCRLAVGGQLVQVSLQACPAITAGLIGGAEFLDI